jgi:hypothetical protein
MNDTNQDTTNDMCLFSVRNASSTTKMVWASSPTQARLFAEQRGFIRNTADALVKISHKDNSLRQNPTYSKVYQYLSYVKYPCYFIEVIHLDNRHFVHLQFAPKLKYMNIRIEVPRFQPVVIKI